MEGGRQAAFKALNALKLIDISNNLGDSKTLACHPASTTHSSVGAAERVAIRFAGGEEGIAEAARQRGAGGAGYGIGARAKAGGRGCGGDRGGA